jgi:hypothetical protein
MESRFNYQPDSYKALLDPELYLRRCGLEGSLLHLIKLRASRINGCAYCLDMLLEGPARHRRNGAEAICPIPTANALRRRGRRPSPGSPMATFPIPSTTKFDRSSARRNCRT